MSARTETFYFLDAEETDDALMMAVFKMKRSLTKNRVYALKMVHLSDVDAEKLPMDVFDSLQAHRFSTQEEAIVALTI